MTNELEALKTCFEVNGMTPEQIAEDRGLLIEAVKAGLMQCSSKYRKLCGAEIKEEDRLNFSDEQLANVNERIYELALHSEDERLQADLCKYIRDDKKGRKDVVKAVQNSQFNILQFNESFQAVRAQAELAKKSIEV